VARGDESVGDAGPMGYNLGKVGSLHGGARGLSHAVAFIGGSSERNLMFASEHEPDGWSIGFVDAQAPTALETLAASPPEAAVFCLGEGCVGDVGGFAQEMLADARFARPLMIFLDGTAEQSASIKEWNPFAVFVTSSELPWVLKRLIPKD
jgi:hypothetical protein